MKELIKASKITSPIYSQLAKARYTFWKSAAAFLLFAMLLLPDANALAQQQTIFLPLISSMGNSLECAGLSSEEIDIAFEFLNDAGQQRPLMGCNPTLSAVARARAQDMANRAYFDHITPEGIGPDTLVERAGYNLPDWYPVTTTSNHVESIAYGTSYITAELAWDALINSPVHVEHLRGQTEFFGGQSEFGVGHSYARGRHYWAILSAHPSQ